MERFVGYTWRVQNTAVLETVLIMQNNVIIQTIDLVKGYIDGGNVIHALRGANIKVYRGEMVAIMDLPAPGSPPCCMYWVFCSLPLLGLMCSRGGISSNIPEKIRPTSETRSWALSFKVATFFQLNRVRKPRTPLDIRGIGPAYQEKEDTRRTGPRRTVTQGGPLVEQTLRRRTPACRHRQSPREQSLLILGDEPTGQLDQKNTKTW